MPTMVQKADEYEVRPSLVVALAWQESNFRPDVVSSEGAVGIMQVMPTRIIPRNRLHELEFGTEAGVAWLAYWIKWNDGDVRKALACYGSGPKCCAYGHADKVLAKEKIMTDWLAKMSAKIRRWTRFLEG